MLMLRMRAWKVGRTEMQMQRREPILLLAAVKATMAETTKSIHGEARIVRMMSTLATLMEVRASSRRMDVAELA